MTAIDNSARIGADVGGTFTDVILQRADGSATIRKLLSTPPNYDAAVVEAVAGLAERHAGRGRRPRDDGRDERGARAPRRADGARHDRRLPRRARAAPAADPAHVRARSGASPSRSSRAGCASRSASGWRADGTVLRALDDDEARAVAAQLRDAGVESVAVCLLHSYLYPEHEERLGAILREELPGVAVSLSSEILREQREYERSATTVVNAYVRPLMERYVGDIRAGSTAPASTRR